MTTKEYFIKTLKEESPKFRKIIEALPEESHGHKVHEKSREAGNLAAQLAVQWKAVSGVLKKGIPDFDPHEMGKQSRGEMLEKFDRYMSQLITDVESTPDQEWENGDATMGDMWKTKKYDMAWGFLFDAIHHRGQLSTYLRAIGAKVPSIYGPTADEGIGNA